MSKHNHQNQSGSWLNRLAGITSFLGGEGSLEDNLNELAATAANMLHADFCSIMLLTAVSDDCAELTLKLVAHHGPIADEAEKENVGPGQGIAGQVLESGKSILVEDIDKSPYADQARRKDQPYRSLIASPIHLNGELIGVINITGNRFPRPFNIDDQNLLDIAALFIGKSIQVMQLQNVLNSRFAQMALAQQEQQALQQKFSANPAQNPDQLAKLLAKTFYRELTRAGLSSSQIISTATEIINQLNSSLSKHKKRMERQ